MKNIAKFEKVSFEQFSKDTQKNLGEKTDKELRDAYEEILLPKRATAASAGYDFVAPFDFSLKPNEMILLPSGIRANIDSAFVLSIFPRSSLGMRYQLMLANTTGIIDADYYHAANEGHIQFPLINRGQTEFVCQKGERIVQGLFLAYYLAEEEEVTTVRSGGFGSSGK